MNASFGARLRLRRHQARLSLESLATLSGVSRATLSKIERGERNPSLSSAARIADALQVPLATMLSVAGASSEAQVVRGDGGVSLVDDETGAIRESVLPVLEGVEIVRYTLPPHCSAGPFHPHSPGAKEVFIVMEGAIEVRSGTHRIDLQSGDVAMVPGDLSHQLTNNGDAPTKVMLVLVRPGVPDLDVLSEEK